VSQLSCARNSVTLQEETLISHLRAKLRDRRARLGGRLPRQLAPRIVSSRHVRTPAAYSCRCRLSPLPRPCRLIFMVV